MRIAHVLNSVEGGGVSTAVPAIAGVLRDAGAELRILALTPRDRRGLPAMDVAGLEVIVREGGETDHLAGLRWLGQQVAAYAPTHIMTSLARATLLGQIVGARQRVPVVSWLHNGVVKRANRLLLQTTRNLTHLWIGDSAGNAAAAAARLRLPPSRLAIWPLFAADPDAPQARPWQPGEPVRLGILGRLHRVKGHDLIMDALGRLRAEGFPISSLELSIAGDGELLHSLQARADHIGVADRITFEGFLDRPRDYLAGLHLYLQPSRSEGMCIAAHEAMQASLPTIVSAVGELRNSVVDHVTGRVVEPAEVTPLAEAIRDLVSKPDRLHAMGQAARARVLDRFGPAAFAAAGAAVIARFPPARRAPASA